MTKWDLIRVALTELRKQWNTAETCEWFDTPEFGSNEAEVSIKWNPKHTADSQGQYIIAKAVTISRRSDGTFSCVILDTASSNTIPHMHRNEKQIADYRWYWQVTKLNREFNALRKKIVQYKRAKENNSFLSDLVKVFPHSMDGEILGSDYDE